MKTVLVVDDEVDMRDAVQAILEAEGYAVVTAANGQRALEAMERGPLPDVLILDVMMPVMTGYQLLERMAASDQLRQVAVVMMSAVQPPARKDPRWKAFLMKPFSLEDLLQTVAQAIEPSADGD